VELRYAIEVDQEFMTVRQNADADQIEARLDSEDQQHGWPAWLLSVVLHATLLIACSLIVPAAARLPPGEPERTVGIALVPHSAAEEAGEAGGGSAWSDAQAAEPASQGSADASRDFLENLPSLDSFSPQFASSLPQTGSSGAGVGLPNAAGFLGGKDTGLPNAAAFDGLGKNSGRGGLSGQGRTQIFGAQGEGGKFVYVFDRSASMRGFQGRPLVAAKRELLRSLDDLTELNQFQIVFYNERPAVLNPAAPARPSILFATTENLRLAQDFIGNITATGGTRHREALELALDMAPDVVFFLTDANDPQLSPRELAELRRRNRASAVIHCIEFGVGSFAGGDNFLVRLARENRGQHVYLDVTTLGKSLAK
jgi:hypothetical protein